MRDKVRTPWRQQAQKLFLKTAGKVNTKQGETPLNPVRDHVLQEQAYKQVQKQAQEVFVA